jgi:putative NADH-flavin reductase
MMRILVFGATGPTGLEIVKLGLELGHEVTAFVRDPQKLVITHHKLSVAIGDARDALAVENAVTGQDAVLSALGTGKKLKGTIFSEGMRSILNGMQRQNAKRFIVMSAHGVGESFKELSFPLRLGVKTVLKSVFMDKEKGEANLRQSTLDWTCVHPVILTDSPRTGPSVYRTGEHIPLGMLPKISRADVAEFMLRIIDDDATIRKTIVISR